MADPITPPPELRRQWLDNDHFSMVTGTHDLMSITRDRLNNVMDQSAQWGADTELEACCGALDELNDGFWSERLRVARRPKPPSLKEQALSEVAAAVAGGNITPERGATIRRALEALDD
jgi:hypothetical protein